MHKKRMFLLLLAVLTALILCACGDASEASSDTEGIQPFGVDVNPSAQPSTGQVVSDNPVMTPATSVLPGASGLVVENDTPTSVKPSPTPADSPVSAVPTTAPASAPTKTPAATDTPVTQSPAPSSRPTGETDTPVTSADTSPAISPPLPASTATIDQAQSYVGKSLATLIADLGYPSSSDYEDVEEENPDTDRIGTLYYDGFTVTTLRTASGETVTAVTAGSGSGHASNPDEDPDAIPDDDSEDPSDENGDSSSSDSESDNSHDDTEFAENPDPT